MYFPKSKITTHQYTNGGEYVIASDNTPYKGYYFKAPNGKVLSGEQPNRGNVLLKPIEDTSPDPNPEVTEVITHPTYKTDLTGGRIPPTYVMPNPTSEDYDKGFISRYMLSKINEIKYIEVSPEEYDRYVNQDSQVLSEMYTPFKIEWLITGDEESTGQANLKTLQILSRDRGFVGLPSYFKDNYTQFL